MLKTLLFAAILSLGLLRPDLAAAHAVLLESQPAPEATLSGAKVDFILHYNSRVDAKRSRLTLKGPSGTSTVLEIHPGKAQADLAATATALPPGRYVLHWDVLSVDGHVSRGEVPFTATDR